MASDIMGTSRAGGRQRASLHEEKQMVAKEDEVTKGVEQFTLEELIELFGEKDGKEIASFGSQKLNKVRNAEMRAALRATLAPGGAYYDRWKELMAPVWVLEDTVKNEICTQMGLPPIEVYGTAPEEEEDDAPPEE